MLVCRHCGNCDVKHFKVEYKGANIGLYCSDCGKWIKWIGKEELRGLEGAGLVVSEPKNKSACAYCGSTDFIKKEVGVHIGLYCKKCGKWHKWIKKP